MSAKDGTPPWSKLQREIYKLIDEDLGIQIHCRAYRMTASRSRSPQIPRFWITLGKDIVFDIPRQAEELQSDWAWAGIGCINYSIREYIDSPLKGLLEKSFLPHDNYGVTDVLKAADRRIGKAKLLEWSKEHPEDAVQKIIVKRFNLDMRTCYDFSKGVRGPVVPRKSREET